MLLRAVPMTETLLRADERLLVQHDPPLAVELLYNVPLERTQDSWFPGNQARLRAESGHLRVDVQHRDRSGQEREVPYRRHSFCVRQQDRKDEGIGSGDCGGIIQDGASRSDKFCAGVLRGVFDGITRRPCLIERVDDLLYVSAIGVATDGNEV